MSDNRQQNGRMDREASKFGARVELTECGRLPLHRGET
jgi:hypothetical protein